MRFDISEDSSGFWFWTLIDDRSGAVLCSPVRFRTQVQAYADIAAFKASVSGAGVLVGAAPQRGASGPSGQLGLL
ncbi:hypothetical protein [Methylobacterium oxalidis]|uniref:DUF1508 domain-containing protein n=1 Tax=Methylobacterium oxalidis TaxID=944322 RepID=A0A512J393_9HYPH|nr:hypothetical protein [Methylobacterium oxalidis]GEP04422.1 hypothetical protein MOX02_24600 [Methylobacterium oxalidis]GJE35225.1 hypothetical protein LDDCCGHA_5443 [Methylobacterium oxalidis]GLS62794.1 hypothetical protein GCM10007888_11750 [Methylobacterium oxalidis]